MNLVGGFNIFVGFLVVTGRLEYFRGHFFVLMFFFKANVQNVNISWDMLGPSIQYTRIQVNVYIGNTLSRLSGEF